MELFDVMFELSAWTGWGREQGLLLVPLTTCFMEKLLNELMVPLVKASAVSTSPVYTTMMEVSAPRRHALGGRNVSLPCEGWTEYTTAFHLWLSSKKEEKLEAVDVGHVRHEFDTWKSEGRWTPINLAIVALIHLGKKIIKKKMEKRRQTCTVS